MKSFKRVSIGNLLFPDFFFSFNSTEIVPRVLNMLSKCFIMELYLPLSSF